MFYFDYPKVKHSLARTALQDPYPAWYMDTRGVIRGANLMAFWLWDTLQPTEPIRPDALLGRSIFGIFANNLKRIPIKQNGEFYAKKSSMVKRMKADPSLESSFYDPFTVAMKRDPQLEKIYEQAALYSDNEWEHPFSVMSPGQRDTSRLLEFQVTIYRLEGDAGFLSMYTPTRETLPDIEEQYGLLIKEYSDNAYVQLDDLSQNSMENDQLPFKFGTHFHAYYPSLIQDPLWYISGDNKAHQLLVGSSIVGAHFFELFFAPQLREWMGPIQETSAPRAIKYFEVFTVTFLDEEHELHSEYEQTIKRLLQLQDFKNLLGVSRRLNIHLYRPDNTEAPFYTCRVILPWPLSPQITLQFRSMAQIIYRNRLVHTDIRDYQVTLVPENYETEVALILLHLQAVSHTYHEDNFGFMTSFMQFLWLLIVIRTVKEGLTRGDEEEDTKWEPEAAFERIREQLAAEYTERAKDETGRIISEFRKTIEALDNKEIVDKESMLTMLYTLTSALNFMDQLSEFLAVEIERYKSVETIENIFL
jgi:hypothetical protein